MPRFARLLVPAAAAAAALAATVGTGGAQSPAPTVADDPAKPLVYVFSLDAQDGDRAIDQGRAPFLGRLVRGEEGARATYYRESRGIMVSETNPNHTAMVTGAYGERSGIPATPSPSTTRRRRRLPGRRRLGRPVRRGAERADRRAGRRHQRRGGHLPAGRDLLHRAGAPLAGHRDRGHLRQAQARADLRDPARQGR
jgi:hypothetical protein